MIGHDSDIAHLQCNIAVLLVKLCVATADFDAHVHCYGSDITRRVWTILNGGSQVNGANGDRNHSIQSFDATCCISYECCL